MRQLCCQLFRVDKAQVLISLPADKTPELWVAGEQQYCSISHSHQMVAVLFSNHCAVGLDVEYIKPAKDKQGYAELYPALRHYCADDAQFYQRWTQLEASLKLNGGQLLTMLAQSQPMLAAELMSWQHLGYQFCIASQHSLAALQQQQVLLP